MRVGRPSASDAAAALILRASPVPDASRLSISATSVLQVVEAPAEMGERRLGVAGLPGADDPFTGAADQPHRAVGVDAAEPMRVAGRAGRARRAPTVSDRAGGPGAAVRDGEQVWGWVAMPLRLDGRHLRFLVPSARTSRAPAARRGARLLRPLLKQVVAARVRRCVHLPRLVSTTTGGRRWPRRTSPPCSPSAPPSSSRSATSSISAPRTRSPTNRSATSSCSPGCCATGSGGWAAWSRRVGFALQAAALGLGSVLLVQALLVTSLLFALPISARPAHRRVTRWEWMWAVLLAAAVAVIVTVGNPTGGPLAGVLGDLDRGGRRCWARRWCCA